MSDRFYSRSFNQNHSFPNFPYIWDNNAVITGNNPISTGAWRPFTVNDVQNNTVTLTGNGISVQNVAVTGGFVAITNVPTVTVGNSFVPVVAFSGVAVTGGSISFTNTLLATSGISTVPYLTGIFSPVFTGFSTGQVQIPAGVKSYSISVLSGSAFVQATLLGQGALVKGGRYGGGFLSNYALNVGCTGQGYTIITWEN